MIAYDKNGQHKEMITMMPNDNTKMISDKRFVRKMISRDRDDGDS